jgi:hypothetical protein
MYYYFFILWASFINTKIINSNNNNNNNRFKEVFKEELEKQGNAWAIHTEYRQATY